MNISKKYELIKQQDIPEIKSKGFYYRHVKTGAEILSIVNDDENKVFGITFRTPPADSTGLPHILEHSVLCGSRKYPVKEPFVELMKGSLQTFLNAMTYPDKTCYPVASQNHADFYNLIDVYLDAVFYPRLTPFVFQQEGWHYEQENPQGPLIYKGVVFNEMKGSYSSPDRLLNEYSMRSLFPDNSYGLDSGGDPRKIPDLTFQQFIEFHRTYYHPSNSRIFFYGDDDPEKRLLILNDYLEGFERYDIDSVIILQKPFERPRRLIRSYASGEDANEIQKGMFTLNWLLPEVSDSKLNFAMHLLEHVLIGMPGSPLRRALIESNLGEDLAGVGLETDLRQSYFSTGMKGIDLEKIDQLQNLILQTLTRLVNTGIDQKDREAAMNSLEFVLRENNTGSYPKGLGIMLRSLTTWLHDEDPLSLIAFENPLNELKTSLAGNGFFLEELIEKHFINNPHRTSLILKPEPGFSQREKEAEEKRLERAMAKMTPFVLREVIDNAQKLKQAQETPDSPAALAAIPMLKLSDLEKENRIIPISVSEEESAKILFHDLFTNKIFYIDVGFDLHCLPERYLPYARLFGKAILEMGTDKEDYVVISQRIGRKTGGIGTAFHTSMKKDSKTGAVWMVMRGKSMLSRANDLLNILKDIILNVKFDNRERFRQILLKARAAEERNLMSAGHHVANLRLRSGFREADRAAEKMGGLDYLFFLRDLEKAVDREWPKVLADLKRIHEILINRKRMLVNITVDGFEQSRIYTGITGFIRSFPAFEGDDEKWISSEISIPEGITIPSQVNYVAKGANIYDSGYTFHGSGHVICRFLRAAWLWEQVRVKGGAYGAFCSFDRLSGTLAYLSYRDPNILKTINAFDRAGDYLRDISLDKAELTKAIIGTIGAIDSYMLPDAKGYTSMIRWLSGEKDDDRQKMRNEILSTGIKEFRAFADVLNNVKENGVIKIVGAESAIKEAKKDWPDRLEVVRGM